MGKLSRAFLVVVLALTFVSGHILPNCIAHNTNELSLERSIISNHDFNAIKHKHGANDQHNHASPENDLHAGHNLAAHVVAHVDAVMGVDSEHHHELANNCCHGKCDGCNMSACSAALIPAAIITSSAPNIIPAPEFVTALTLSPYVLPRLRPPTVA